MNHAGHTPMLSAIVRSRDLSPAPFAPKSGLGHCVPACDSSQEGAPIQPPPLQTPGKVSDGALAGAIALLTCTPDSGECGRDPSKSCAGRQTHKYSVSQMPCDVFGHMHQTAFSTKGSLGLRTADSRPESPSHRGCAVRGRMVSSIPGLYPKDASGPYCQPQL